MHCDLGLGVLKLQAESAAALNLACGDCGQHRVGLLGLRRCSTLHIQPFRFREKLYS